MAAARPADWKFSCGICHRDHALRTCKEFLRYNADERYDMVVVKKYCINCLARSHLKPECNSNIKCRECSRRHNTLLHGAHQLSSTMSKNDSKIDPTNTSRRSYIRNAVRRSEDSCPPYFNWNRVFIPTASLRISTTKTDTWISTRAVINNALPVSQISKSFVKKYKLQTTLSYAHDFVTFTIRSHNNNNKWHITVTALVTETLPKKPYSAPIYEDPTDDFPENSLADIDPRSNTAIDIELGSDVYPMIRRDGSIETELGKVVAEKSALGYLFSGPVNKLW